MGFVSSAGLLNGPGRADGIALHLPRSLRIVVPVPVLAVLLWGHGAQAQPITYSVNGVLTSVPSCVSRVFSVGDRWTINVVIEERDPDLDQDLDQGAGIIQDDWNLHLHGFKEHHNRPSFQPVADIGGDLPHQAGHHCFQFTPHFLLPWYVSYVS